MRRAFNYEDMTTIEQRGSWFVAFDAKGKKVGAKMSYTAALELLNKPKDSKIASIALLHR